MFQGRELAPGATTDRGYTITFEQFEDSACTTAVGDFDGGLPISGPSATCIPNTNEGETAFGFYGYCDSTGAGGYEYVVSAAQCPPGEGSEGGECFFFVGPLAFGFAHGTLANCFCSQVGN